MSPRTSEQFDKIRQEKKELIMETSLELFAEFGYHTTSISQIAKKAGISKGLIYNYFESKKDILDELLKHGFDEVAENFDLNHDGVLSKEEFIFFIRKNFDLVNENFQHWKLFFSLVFQPQVSESFKSGYERVSETMFKMMFDFIVSMGSTDPEGDLIAISAMIEGAFLYAIAAPEIFPIKKMEEKIINTIFRLLESYNNESTSKL